MLLFVSNVQAEKIFHILLSADENAPTPDMVVAESLLSPPSPTPLLAAFTQFRPDRVDYIISQRPVGDLAAFVNAHPQWTMSKLYRYLTVFYDDSIDETQVDAALTADPFIVGALFITPDLTPQLSTPASVTNNSNAKIINGTPNSYLNDLGIPSAWELSEGSGYIGVVDTGIEVNHPAFVTFDSNGIYQGGNVLTGLYNQYDVADVDFNVDEKQPAAIVPELSRCEDTMNNPRFGIPFFAGHGTHVAGIMAANNSVSPENGICKNCGLSVIKYVRHRACQPISGEFFSFNFFQILGLPNILLMG